MPAPSASPAPRAFTLAWAATLFAALTATWPLWTPLRDTPRLGPFAFLSAVPPGVDFLLLATLGLGLHRAVGGALSWRSGVAMAAGSLAGLMAFDQLRWQPWAYHAVIAGILLTSASRQRALGCLRLVAIAVYAYSALAKLDAEFAATLGQQMLTVLLGPVGIDLSAWSDTTRHATALAMPVGELALAGLLAASIRWRRLATPACVMVVLMHAATIGLLGPWGLGHSLGVLLWNAGFAWQTVVLFRPDREQAEDAARRPFGRLATIACGLAILPPALTPFGLWDQWPGWGLYAPSGERATLYVHSSAVSRLPDSLQRQVEEPGEGPWRRLRLDRWTLAETGAPIYPQNRVVAAIATGLAERYPLSGRLRLTVETAATRIGAVRQSEVLEQPASIEAESRLLGLGPGVVWTR